MSYFSSLSKSSNNSPFSKMAGVVKRVQVTGFTEYLRAVEEYKNSSLHLFALFTGSPNQNGDSWCPDCVTGESAYVLIVLFRLKVC